MRECFFLVFIQSNVPFLPFIELAAAPLAHRALYLRAIKGQTVALNHPKT